MVYGASVGKRKFWFSVLTEIKNRGVQDVCIVVCDGLRGLPDAVTATWELATVQASSLHTSRWRDGLAGHSATGRGPMQTRAFEALMQTRPFRWRRHVVAAGVALRAP
jgi:hypothetical protein